MNKKLKRRKKRKNRLCIKKIPGVICDAKIKKCGECPFWKGIGIIPVIRKDCGSER